MYGLLNLIFVTLEFLLFVNHLRASSSLSGGMCHVTQEMMSHYYH